MVRELIFDSQQVQIKFKKEIGIILLIMTYVVCFGIGALFISIPFLDNPGAKEFLYFGIFFTICGTIGLLKLPSQLRNMGDLLEFSADLNGIKYNHHIYEKDKIQSLGWDQISKIILVKKMISKTGFGSSNYSWNSLVIYFRYPNQKETGFIKNESKRLVKSPKGDDLTVLSVKKGYEDELTEALRFFSKNKCTVKSWDKVIFNYQTKEEKYVS